MRINFSIEQCDKGFVVNVGCKRIATSMEFDEIIAELKEYFIDPYEIQRKWFPDDFCDEEVERVEDQGRCNVPTIPPPLPTSPQRSRR